MYVIEENMLRLLKSAMTFENAAEFECPASLSWVHQF